MIIFNKNLACSTQKYGGWPQRDRIPLVIAVAEQDILESNQGR
jgi:hypothetical protein